MFDQAALFCGRERGDDLRIVDDPRHYERPVHLRRCFSQREQVGESAGCVGQAAPLHVADDKPRGGPNKNHQSGGNVREDLGPVQCDRNKKQSQAGPRQQGRAATSAKLQGGDDAHCRENPGREPPKVHRPAGFQRFGTDDLDIDATRSAPAGHRILIAQPGRNGRHHNRFASQPTEIGLTVQHIGSAEGRNRSRLEGIVDPELGRGVRALSRQHRRQGGNVILAAAGRKGDGPNFIGVIVANAKRRKAHISSEHRQRTDVFDLTVPCANALQIADGHVPVALERPGELGVFVRDRRIREHEIMDLFLGLCGADGIDQLRISSARPRPPADLAERLFVDPDQHDVAADGPFIDMIAYDAKPVLGIFAGAGQAEQKAEHQRPAENPFRTLGLPCTVLSAQPSHGKGGSFCLITSLRRKGLTNRKPNRINGPAAYFGAVRR